MTQEPPTPDAKGRLPVDGGMAGVLFAIGTVVAAASLATGGLAHLGACYESCTDRTEASITLLYVAIPVGYVVACLRFMRSVRRQRLEAAAAGKPVPYTRARSAAGFGLVALVLALFLGIAGCFTLIEAL